MLECLLMPALSWPPPNAYVCSALHCHEQCSRSRASSCSCILDCPGALQTSLMIIVYSFLVTLLDANASVRGYCATPHPRADFEAHTPEKEGERMGEEVGGGKGERIRGREREQGGGREKGHCRNFLCLPAPLPTTLAESSSGLPSQ